MNSYEEYLNQELPSLVEQQLQDLVEEEFQPIKENLSQRVADIVRQCQQTAFQSYQRRSHQRILDTSDPSNSGNNAQVSSSQPIVCPNQTNEGVELLPFLSEPPLIEADSIISAGQEISPSEVVPNQNFSDSGYMSNGWNLIDEEKMDFESSSVWLDFNSMEPLLDNYADGLHDPEKLSGLVAGSTEQEDTHNGRKN